MSQSKTAQDIQQASLVLVMEPIYLGEFDSKFFWLYMERNRYRIGWTTNNINIIGPVQGSMFLDEIRNEIKYDIVWANSEAYAQALEVAEKIMVLL